MKLTLTIQEGSLAGRKFELSVGHLSIGRNSTCSVRFDPFKEKVVSGQHAFIENRADGFYLTDNSSTNGTFVNGSRVQSIKLGNGDSIQFGTNGINASISIESSAAIPRPSSTGFSYEPKTSIDAQQFSKIGETFQRQQDPTIVDSVSSIGLGHFEVEPEPSQTGKYIGIAVTLIAIVFLSLIVMGLMLLQLGPVAAVAAALMAFIPALFYILPIIWLDRYDPEPLWLLALAFSWGALVAILFSIVVNTVIGVSVARTISPEAGELAMVVFSAPIFEEASKGAGLLIVVLFFRKYFDGILDGIIFGSVVALGFATVENMTYYGGGIVSGIPLVVIILFVVRGILSPFAHATFTSMTGIGFGLARESHNSAIKVIAPIVGYGCAVFLHFVWNGMGYVIAYVTGLPGLLAFLLGYIILEVPFFGAFVWFTGHVMYKQNKILKEMLAIDVARGLIPQEDFERATSAFRSTGWVIGSVFKGKFLPTTRYIRAIGKLGLSYWHIQRATQAQGHTASFQQNPILREEVLKWRDQV